MKEHAHALFVIAAFLFGLGMFLEVLVCLKTITLSRPLDILAIVAGLFFFALAFT